MVEPEHDAPAAAVLPDMPRGGVMSAMALFMAMIAYGSLYPFAFHAVPHGVGPLHVLIGGWNKTPGRGDFISNILLYMPLGFAGAISVGKRAGLGQMALAILIGAVFSLSMEISQYYDTGRDTEATDLYANTLGTALGAFIGWILGQDFGWPLRAEVTANRIPALLLLAWLGYRLYPYVPTINMHKYWGALKPLFLYPDLTFYGLLRQTAIWLAIRALIEKIAGPERSTAVFRRFAGFIFLASVLIISTWITLPQIAGLAAAAIVWRMLSPWPRAQTRTAALAMLANLVFFRLAPFHFADAPGSYGWVPFFGFMQGSIDTDVQAFFEKGFLYGSTIWLLAEIGMAVRFATLLTAALLFACSLGQAYLPGRSAEVTDAVLALVAGLFIRSTRVRRIISTSADTLTRRLRPAGPREELELETEIETETAETAAAE